MSEDRPLPRALLRVGLPVAYRGPDAEVLDWGGPPVVGVLRHGHPGRVQDATEQHVLVAWEGLEDADVSQVVGFSVDDATGKLYLGLGPLTEDEHERRIERLRSGW